MNDLILLKDLKKTVKDLLYEETDDLKCGFGSALNPFDGKCYSIIKVPEHLPSGPILDRPTIGRLPGVPSDSPTARDMESQIPKKEVKKLIGKALLEITDPNVLADEPVDCSYLSFIVGFGGARASTFTLKAILKQAAKITRGALRATGRITNQGLNAAFREAAIAAKKSGQGFGAKLVKFLAKSWVVAVAAMALTSAGMIWAGVNTLEKVNQEGGVLPFADKVQKFYDRGDGEGFLKWYLDDAWSVKRNWCFWAGFAGGLILTKKNFELGINAAAKSTRVMRDSIKALPFRWFKKTVSEISEATLDASPGIRQLFVMNKLKTMLGGTVDQPIKIIVRGSDTVMEVTGDAFISITRAQALSITGREGGESLLKELFGEAGAAALTRPGGTMASRSIRLPKSMLNNELKVIASETFDAAKVAAKDAWTLGRNTPAARLIHATLETIKKDAGRITADFHSKLANRLGSTVLKSTEELVDSLDTLILACARTETKMLNAAADIRKFVPNFPDDIIREVAKGVDPTKLKKAMGDWLETQALSATKKLKMETHFDELISTADSFFKQRTNLTAAVGGFNKVVKHQAEGMLEAVGRNVFEDVLGNPGLRSTFARNIGEVLSNAAKYLKPDDWVAFSGAFASLGLGGWFLVDSLTRLKIDDQFRTSHDVIGKYKETLFAGDDFGKRVSILDNLIVNYLKRHDEKIIKMVIGTGPNTFEKGEEIEAGKYIFNDVIDFAERKTDDPEGGMKGCLIDSVCETGWIQAQAGEISEEDIEKVLKHWKTAMEAMKPEDKTFGVIGQWFVVGSRKHNPIELRPGSIALLTKFKSIFFHFFEPYVAYMKNPKGFKNKQGKEIEEMKKMSLKEIVKEVIKEESGRGYSPSQYYDPDQEENPEDVDTEYKSLLAEFDQDPGYDFAVHIGKCLVQNKETMRELLELALQVPELRSELVLKLKQMS